MISNNSSALRNADVKISWGLLLVLCGAIFLEGIDVSMMGVALPSIRDELNMTTGELSWVASAYVLGYGGFMLLGGRAADLLGRRRMFLGWLLVFLLFSGLGGMATEGWILILSRFVTGVAAAFMTPAGLSIITTSFPEGPSRNKALLVYAGTAAAGFSLGLVVGGLLTAVDWRWVFFAPVALALIILLAGIRLIPYSGRPERSSHGFDLAGAVSVTGAMLLLVSAVINAPETKWVWTIGTAAASLVLMIAFIAIERRSASPLMRLGILRSGALVRANLGALLLAGSFFGFQFIAVLYLQELRGWSALETGLALLAIGIDAVLAPTVTPRLVNRFGYTRVIFGGFSIAAVSYALFLPVDLDWTYAAMFPTMILTGIAFALTYGPLTIAATDGIAEEEQGLASGILSTSIQFGAALGLAVVTAVSVISTGTDGSPQAMLDGFRSALIVPVAGTVLGATITATGFRKRVERRRGERLDRTGATFE
ncbi:MFS transporter [Paenibacillus sedimenti]|uniref:MFS transporter n=1 Tax=Paenibacillus sedimenti TaxID=2770274 RepID=A0A926KMM8_9BACL|nr:MFS transporter [Paenibacillus sedimenti]MBD0378830.1 MFS transporter [Paenibacillus sedimenti]